jgi:hypothetical protein
MRTRMSAGILLAALTLAACGGGGGDSGDASGGTGSADIHAAAVYYAQCMRSKGYNMPDPTFDEDDNPVFQEPDLAKNLDKDTFLRDRQECNRRLNEAWAAAGRPNRKEQDRQGLLAFAQCMREKGVNVPDPDAQGGWVLDKKLLNSPAWGPAAQACRDKLPAGMDLPGGKK